MEHVSSARPTWKFPEKVENLKRWARFPGWNLRTECRVPFTFLVVRTSSRSTVGHRDVPGFKTNGLQLITNRKFHFCSHRNFGVFFLNGKRPGLPFQNFRLSREFFAPCKGIQDTLGFWIPRRGFRIPFTGFQIFLGGTWIPDSNC